MPPFECSRRYSCNTPLFVTLIVSSGCPANTRAIPPTPPAKKFFNADECATEFTSSAILKSTVSDLA